MTPIISRGFRGRRRDDGPPGRVPPGQYVTDDFPVLSAGPDAAHAARASGTSRSSARSTSSHRWTWEEFRALPSEEVTVDIHCVTKWSKLDTTWEGVARGHAARRRRDLRRVRRGVLRRRLHDEPPARGRHRRQGVDRVRLRRRAARSRARRPGAPARPAPLLLEERQVGARAPACLDDEPGFWEQTATTSTATRGGSSGTGATDLACRPRSPRSSPRRRGSGRFASTCPTGPATCAGQHVDVRLTAEDGYQAQRSYSIASPPGAPRWS